MNLLRKIARNLIHKYKDSNAIKLPLSKIIERNLYGTESLSNILENVICKEFGFKADLHFS